MKIISITGGVGSGTSEVLRVLQEEFDAEIIKADEVAHQPVSYTHLTLPTN